MPMFSFDKSSYEFNLLNLLQGGFFRIAKRNKILAKWAAGRLGLKSTESNNYVKGIIFSYLAVPNDRKIVKKILSDFEASNIKIDEDIIWKKIKSIETRIDNKEKLKDDD